MTVSSTGNSAEAARPHPLAEQGPEVCQTFGDLTIQAVKMTYPVSGGQQSETCEVLKVCGSAFRWLLLCDCEVAVDFEQTPFRSGAEGVGLAIHDLAVARVRQSDLSPRKHRDGVEGVDHLHGRHPLSAKANHDV